MIGKVLGNRYEIIEKVGGGGMALVYKAKCRLLNRYVAIKVLRNEFTNDDEFIKKFKRESQAAASLSHPNIVNIYDTGVEDNVYYIVMEYVDGKTLKQYIREKGRLSVKETIDITIQIAEALNHAHRNHIVHRDIKPHNILITNEGMIKVADFGIARAATSTTVTNTGNVIGSVHYFSPEQARGGYTDEKSDIYSLGVVMYEMLTGRVPFEGDSPISVALKHVQEDMVPPTTIVKTIPKNIEKIVMKAVEKDQSLRYNNALELLSDLKKVQNHVDEDCIEFKDYSDSPTKVIPAVKDDMLMSDKNVKRKRKKNNKPNGLITAAAILLALITTCVLAYGAFNVFKDDIVGKEIKVPNLVGKSEEEARKIIEELGLEFSVKDRQYSDVYKEGHVMKQNANPGDTRKEGYPIEVVISKGQKLVEVPNLINEYSNEVSFILDEFGLNDGDVTYDYSDVVPWGLVIRQDPEPGTKVPEGSEVDYVISRGPEVQYILMQNYIGKNVEEAKKDILAKGFAIGDIKYQPSDEFAKDIVIDQNYPAGSEVEENTPIDLIVSSGPSEETTDSNINENNDDMTNEGQQNENSENNDENDTAQRDNEEVKSVQLWIKLPQDKDEVEVRIDKIQKDVKELVYNKTHKTSEKEIAVTLSGTGKVKFEVYIDGVFKGQEEINFEEVN